MEGRGEIRCFCKKMSARNAAAAIESAANSVFAKSFGKIKQ